MRRIRGLVALAVAGATLASGCITATAAETQQDDAGGQGVTIQQDSSGTVLDGDTADDDGADTGNGDNSGSVDVTPKPDTTGGSTTGTNEGAGSGTASGATKQDATAKASGGSTASPQANAASPKATAPKATAPSKPQAKTETKTTPEASKDRKGTIHVQSQESTSLSDVTVRLYRIGTYPDGLDKAKASKLSWDDLHAVSTDDTVKGLASKAVASAGVRTSGDPVDVMWHLWDAAARKQSSASLAAALKKAGVKPTATVTGDDQDASVPEGVYLGVPDLEDGEANLGASTLDGTGPFGSGMGQMTVLGRFDGPSPELAEMPDGVREDADGNGSAGLLSRMFSMFSVVQRTGEPFTLLGHRDYYLKPDAATGIFDLRDDTLNKPVIALCVQAGAETPDNGTKFTRYDYSWNTEQENMMRAVVYYSPYGPGTNVMKLGKGDKALGYMHYVFSAIHNHREDDIPLSVRNSGEYKALKKAATEHPQPYTTGIRLMFYSIDPNIKNKQNLIFFDTNPGWTAEITTNAMYSNSGTNGWRKVSQDRPARIFTNKISLG
ncbi:hypothetical protein, partial [Bifidobacterium simiarum]|uniref:hypothetical protein n=1 Tax=Bifidobacterium simiarum TaxID=2045441 RepID=UPI001BDC9D29